MLPLRTLNFELLVSTCVLYRLSVNNYVHDLQYVTFLGWRGLDGLTAAAEPDLTNHEHE
jgi:hypothetical protein